MKKKELGITEGEVRTVLIDLADFKQCTVVSEEANKVICHIGFGANGITEQDKDNANLIADAFNTSNKCGLLPSELLWQNRKLLSALKDLVVYCRGNMTNQLEPLISKANEIINQIEQ